MENDWFTPTGTFVDFEWHSFETDGPLDLMAGDVEALEWLETPAIPQSDDDGEPESSRQPAAQA